LRETSFIVIFVAPFLGSFVVTLAQRFPNWYSVVYGRSRCDNCRSSLAIRDLVPLLSWLFSSGKCRCCTARINRIYPFSELGFVLCGFAAVLIGDTEPQVVALSIFGWLAILCALTDILHRRIPNVANAILLVGGLTYALSVPDGITGPTLGAIAGFSTIAMVRWSYSRLRNRVGIGLGDAKLAGAIGAWVNWWNLPEFFLLASMLGLAGITIGATGRGKQLDRASKIPFAPYLGLAGWMIFAQDILLNSK
jgi:leader peptidase (prepilin peptidase)/N-methyltransferase